MGRVIRTFSNPDSVGIELMIDTLCLVPKFSIFTYHDVFVLSCVCALVTFALPSQKSVSLFQKDRNARTELFASAELCVTLLNMIMYITIECSCFN